jgi:cytochrome c biogenesis protein CcdA
MDLVLIGVAVVAEVATFLSPCVLPVLPVLPAPRRRTAAGGGR